MPKMIAAVPAAIGKVRCSPSRNTPKAAPNRGVVALTVLVRVGPRYRTPQAPRLADMKGRKKPTATNIAVAAVSQ